MGKIKKDKWVVEETNFSITINEKLSSSDIAKIVNAVAKIERRYLGDERFSNTKWEIITEKNNVS